MVVLNRERYELDQLIDERARGMWEGGLVGEVRCLLAEGYTPDLPAFKSLGYRQAVAVLQGRLTEREALLAMQQATRRYARRQLIWFRREVAAEWRMVHGWNWVETLAEELVVRLAQGERAVECRISHVE